MLSLPRTAVVCTVSAGIGYVLGRRNDHHHVTFERRSCNDRQRHATAATAASSVRSQNQLQAGNVPPSNPENDLLKSTPPWYELLPTLFSVSAASAPLDRSSLPSLADGDNKSAALVVTPANRQIQIMKFGYPNFDNVRFYENYVVAYDRRNRTAHWVFEHIMGDHCTNREGVGREKSAFKEDQSVHPYFRATNADYKGSGYDRGHLAAASNHRHSQLAMDQTFLLSNVSPQVGVGFNRGAWNDLEKYTRALARNNRCVYVCSGPLYLPRKDNSGKQFVSYEVIGPNNVAVPTHFFKVVVTEDTEGRHEMKSFVLPNQPLPSDVKLKVYQRPLESIERAAGFLLFEKIPKKAFKRINGEKPR